MRIKQAGNYPQGPLIVEGIGYCCGKICQGVGVTMNPHRGGWVMDKDDILKLADLIRKYEPRTCTHHKASK